jgi:hypothetical protein
MADAKASHIVLFKKFTLDRMRRRFELLIDDETSPAKQTPSSGIKPGK